MSIGLAIASGAMQGLEKATANLQNLQLATYKLKQDQEAFNLDKKVKEAQLKRAEWEMGPENIGMLREEHNLNVKAKELAYKKGEVEINKAQQQLSIQKRLAQDMYYAGSKIYGQEIARGVVQPQSQTIPTEITPYGGGEGAWGNEQQLLAKHVAPATSSFIGGMSTGTPVDIKNPSVAKTTRPGFKVTADGDISYDPENDVKAKREERQIKQAEFGNAYKLRREFIDRPEVKEYIAINTKVKTMDAILKKALSGGSKNNVALDQALNTLYNEITDPNSVVRESEYARTPENLPTVHRIIGAIEKVLHGGAGLTDEDRKALVIGAKIIGNERGKIYNQTRQEYEDISNEYGLDTKLTLRGMKPHEVYSEIGGSATSIPKGRISVVGPDGQEGHIPESQLNEALSLGYKRVGK